MTLYSLKDQFKELVKATVDEKQNNDKVKVIDESAKSQDFQINKDSKQTKYTTARIKSRNFLSNVAYVGINREDFYNENIICLFIDYKKFESIYARQKIN